MPKQVWAWHPDNSLKLFLLYQSAIKAILGFDRLTPRQKRGFAGAYGRLRARRAIPARIPIRVL
jgi:hypothetical protein